MRAQSHTFWSGLLLAWALAVSCSKLSVPDIIRPYATDDGGNRGIDSGFMPTNDAGLPLAHVCPTLNQARCETQTRCGLIENSASAFDVCVRQLENTWCGPLTWPTHVAKEALRYDAVKAEICAAQLRLMPCENWEQLPESCNFLSPRVPLGGNCYDGFTECIDGVCRGQSCPKTCQPIAVAGELCTEDTDCGDRAFCQRAPSGSGAKQCAAKQTLASPCQHDIECLTPLACLGGECAELPRAGSACVDTRCESSSVCVGLDGGTCFSLAADAGSACAPWNACLGNTTCVGASEQTLGTCEPSLTLGEPCTTSAECQAHLTCLVTDAGQSQCTPKQDTSSPCSEDNNCQAGSACVAQRCTPLPSPGEACDSTGACRWGSCRTTAHSDAGATCRVGASAGQPCVDDGECASLRCESGTCTARCSP